MTNPEEMEWQPIKIIIFQAYAPTTNIEDEIENIYVTKEETDHVPKQDMLIITGDWKEKVQKKAELNLLDRNRTEMKLENDL